MQDIRVLLMTNIVSPYRIPLFNYVSERASFQFKVAFLAETEANRSWKIYKEKIKFHYVVVPGIHFFIKQRELPVHLNWKLGTLFRTYRPDVIITSGYESPAYWAAALYCKGFKKKFILWNGTTLLSTRSLRGPIGWLKRTIIRWADAYLTYGTKAADYLRLLGAKESHIHIGVNTVDMEEFRCGALEAYQNKATELERQNYPKFLLLFVGQLIERKGVKDVLLALKEIKDKEIGLLILGNGPQEQELKSFCANNSISNVYFLGFKQQEELLRYYTLADALVLPSYEEVWGLVVNEALACGLYILCSKAAGAAYDLLQDGWNGSTFAPGNVDELVNLIMRTKANLTALRSRRGEISERACREFSIERSGMALMDAVKDVVG